MKKIALLVVSLLAISTVTSSAQEGFGWGIKAGVNVSNITNLDDYSARAGFVGGVFVDYNFSRVFTLSGDVLYSAKGARYDSDNKLRLHYLDIPILANFRIVEGLTFKTGLQPGFLLGANKVVNDTNHKNTDGFYKAELAIPVGLAYEFNNGIILDARYNFGVTDINATKIDNKMRNNAFSFTLGYRF